MKRTNTELSEPVHGKDNHSKKIKTHDDDTEAVRIVLDDNDSHLYSLLRHTITKKYVQYRFIVNSLEKRTISEFEEVTYFQYLKKRNACLVVDSRIDAMLMDLQGNVIQKLRCSLSNIKKVFLLSDNSMICILHEPGSAGCDICIVDRFGQVLNTSAHNDAEFEYIFHEQSNNILVISPGSRSLGIISGETLEDSCLILQDYITTAFVDDETGKIIFNCTRSTIIVEKDVKTIKNTFVNRLSGRIIGKVEGYFINDRGFIMDENMITCGEIRNLQIVHDPHVGPNCVFSLQSDSISSHDLTVEKNEVTCPLNLNIFNQVKRLNAKIPTKYFGSRDLLFNYLIWPQNNFYYLNDDRFETCHLLRMEADSIFSDENECLLVGNDHKTDFLYLPKTTTISISSDQLENTEANITFDLLEFLTKLQIAPIVNFNDMNIFVDYEKIVRILNEYLKNFGEDYKYFVTEDTSKDKDKLYKLLKLLGTSTIEIKQKTYRKADLVVAYYTKEEASLESKCVGVYPDYYYTKLENTW